MSDPVLVLREALAKDSWSGRDHRMTYSEDDARLIVAARNLLPVLLDEVEALRKVVQDVRAAAEGWRPFWGGCCEVHSAATDAYNEAADEVQRLLAVLDKEEEK